MWHYKSEIGDIYIKKLRDGRYGMEYVGIIWDACNTPQAVADNVYMQMTGCDKWDSHEPTPFGCIPPDLSEWEEY